MGKKSKKVKRKAPRQLKPDETFSSGPFQMARFGKNMISRMDWLPGQYEAAQDHLASNYEQVVAKIDAAVAEAAQIVAGLPPLKLLHRAWWQRAAAMIKVESTDDIGMGEVLAERMVDYVQSLIAGVQPSEQLASGVSEEDWQRLTALVETIYNTLNISYFLSSAAKRRREDPSLSAELEEFSYKAQLHWANVKVNQYQAHQVSSMRELLDPQSGILEEVYGISSTQLCDALHAIWHAQTFGIGDAFAAMDSFRTKSLDLMDSDIAAGLTDLTLSFPEQFQQTIKRHGLEDEQARGAGMFLGYDLFDVSRLADLPEQFLLDFSWEPGGDTEFMSDGAFRGWPLRLQPIFKRPFLKIGDRYYCFDLATVFDHFYRQLEKRVFAFGQGRLKQTWIANRKDLTESLPFDYVSKILPGAKQRKGVYYRALGENGKTRLFETDGVVLFDDHLFVIEIKSGAFTYTSPATDSEAFVNSLKSLVENPAKQGNRFLNYLRSNPEAALLDKDGNEVEHIRLGDFRHVTVCAVTLDPFTEIASQVQHLRSIGVDVGDEPIWSLSIDDLRVYADVFTNPLEFLHFAEQRRRAFNSDILQLDDELDHLGLYLKHNQYDEYARDMVGDANTRLMFTGYRIEVDKFFASRVLDPATPSPLRQEMPLGLVETLDVLAQRRAPESARIAATLLDLAGGSRTTLFEGIATQVSGSAIKPPGPVSTFGDVRITAFPWHPAHSRDSQKALDHVMAMMLLNAEQDRVMLELELDLENHVQGVSWRYLLRSEISPTDLPRLSVLGEELRLRRIAHAKQRSGKIGRNDPCPCGSTKKYKKCCLHRDGSR